MPKENKHSRGRRGDNKRKRDETENAGRDHKKSRAHGEDDDDLQIYGTDVQFEAEEDQLGEQQNDEQGGRANVPSERPFYGLLTDEEQEYFRRADELLENNDFPSDEERSLFLANIYKEAEGKELKIANSQSCSRLMERLILLSTPAQKKTLFQKFSGNFPHLVQHRFASHCCETLFIQSAAVVTQEFTGDDDTSSSGIKKPEAGMEVDEIFVSMENMFLYTLNELEGQMTFLLTDRFASHALRVLLVILSGRPLAKASTSSLLQSKRKEKIDVTGLEPQSSEFTLNQRTVPESFSFAIDKIISDTVATLDTTSVRVLATHPTGNPSLQLLLELELTGPGKQKSNSISSDNSLMRKLLSDDMSEDESESLSFINGLMYDPIGSRLLETIVAHAPGKLFKQIYRTVFKERIGSLARNETAAYVVIKVLKRLSKEDLEEAVTLIIPQIPGLVERSRATIIKSLFERCQARNATKTISALTDAVDVAYGSDPAVLILKMSHFSAETQEQNDSKIAQKATVSKATPDQLHGSLLAQAMLSTPGPPEKLIRKSLLELSPATLLQFSLTPTTSHILQTSLLPSRDQDTTLFTRKLLHRLAPHTLPLALSPSGSHLLDSIWTATSPSPSQPTNPLFHLKEQIAAALAAHEPQLRDSHSGRVVWRNWMCDLFKRRRGDWVKRARAGEGGAWHGRAAAATAAAVPSSSLLSNGLGQGRPAGQGTRQSSHTAAPDRGEKRGGQDARNSGGGMPHQRPKSGIELAREKFAAAKLKGAGSHAARADGERKGWQKGMSAVNAV